ncbi:MAG: Photosystem I reaction center subunit IX [Chroococcales cyanobacterium]
MDSFVKFLSLGPVVLMVWLSFTATLLIVANNIYPDALVPPF